MAYTKTPWVNEALTGAAKYQIIDDTEGELAASASIEQITPGDVGTPLNATNLNKIEQGIADAHDGLALGVPEILLAKGDLAVATGAKTATRLPASATAGRVLTTDATQPTGLKWALNAVLDMIAAKGDLIAGTGADAAARIAAGANGQTLIADSAQAAGVKWGNLIAKRQGGNLTDWSIGGTNNYDVGELKIYAGVKNFTIAVSETWKAEIISFPTAFSSIPLVLSTIISLGSTPISYTVVSMQYAISLASFNVLVKRDPAAASTLAVNVGWLAIGSA